MKEYLNFQPEDFAQDEFFIGWVKSTDLEAETYWQNWLETYPFMRHKVETARKIVLLAHSFPTPVVTDPELTALKQSVFRKVEKLEGNTTKTRRIGTAAYLAAAVSVGILILFTALWDFNPSETTPAAAYTAPPLWSEETVEAVNSGRGKRLVTLPDGSSVLLKGNSKISYPAAFTGSMREIHLAGEAFFEITKDSLRPFLVRTQELTTRVLGTSFNIRAYPDNGQVSVFVKTGKVSVYRSAASSVAGADSIVLVPNQEAFFTRDKKKIIAKEPVKETGVAASGEIDEMLFEYDEALVGEIFGQIEKAYNVSIVYDKNLFGHCPVTASLTGEPFHEKLKLICMAVRADFKVQGDHIVIAGLGCDNDTR